MIGEAPSSLTAVGSDPPAPRPHTRGTDCRPVTGPRCWSIGTAQMQDRPSANTAPGGALHSARHKFGGSHVYEFQEACQIAVQGRGSRTRRPLIPIHLGHDAERHIPRWARSRRQDRVDRVRDRCVDREPPPPPVQASRPGEGGGRAMTNVIPFHDPALRSDGRPADGCGFSL